MKRTYNIGIECYALLTSPNDPDFLLPAKIIVLERCVAGNRNAYKVKIRDLFETNFAYLKEHLVNIKYPKSVKDIIGSGGSRTPLIKKVELDKIENQTELLTLLNDKPFFIEDNYMTLDKEGLKDLYIKFVKYLINYHYEKMFGIVSRSFIGSSPIFENQKEMFKKRIEKIGFGDVFQKFGLELKI